jgi:hypothetical protein
MKKHIKFYSASLFLLALLSITIFQLSNMPYTHASPGTLHISIPAGYGTVSSDSFTCSGYCDETVEQGTTLTLTVTPDAGKIFVGGDGTSCPFGTPYSGVATCTYTLNSSSASLNLSWAYSSYTVTASSQGSGSGKVTGTGTYHYGDNVTLKAVPDAGSVFSGWQTSGNACYGGGGKAADTTVNTNSVCTFQLPFTGWQTFTAVPKFDINPNATTSTPKTTTKNSTPTPPQVVNPPAALTPESMQIDGKAVTPDQKVTMQSDKSMELSGKTVPNGVVNLYVFSEPKKYTVTADKDGNWTYEVKGLEPGEHHIEAEVTDPATGKTSSRAQVLAFSVVKAAATTTAVPTQINATKKANTLTIVGAVVGTFVLLAALTTAGLWKFKRNTFNAMLHRLHLKKESLPPPSLL